MRRPVATLVAATTTVILSAGPAFAHDKAAGEATAPRPAKARLELSCGPAAGEVPVVRCRWSAAGEAARYVVYRDTRGRKWSTVVVKTGDRVLEDTRVVAGTAYAYRVKAIDAQGRRIGASPTVKVRCCGDAADAKQAEAKQAEAKRSKEGGSAKPTKPAGAPATGERAKVDKPRAEAK